MNDECEHEKMIHFFNVVFSHDFEIGNKLQFCSDGSGSIIFDPGRVSHLWFEFGFGKFPLKK